MADVGGVDEERDWSELHPDLLQVITGSFTEISDHFRFRSVCKSWRSASPNLPLPQEGPYLLVLPNTNSPEQEDDCHVINPVNNCRRFTLRTQYSLRMKSCQVYESPYGFFLVLDETSGFFSVTNPLISGSWTTLPASISSTDDTYVCMAKIFESDDSEMSIVVTLGQDNIPYLLRDGYNSWRPMYYDGEMVFDIVLYKGSFYLVEAYECTVVLDSDTLTKTCEIEHPEIETDEDVDEDLLERFLVESSDGELLLVAWDTYYTLWIFRLDSSGKQPKWVMVKSIGDDTLFLCDHCALCFPTGRLDGFKANCVYFVPAAGKDRHMSIFNIEDDTVEYLPHVIRDRRALWMIPSRT